MLVSSIDPRLNTQPGDLKDVSGRKGGEASQSEGLDRLCVADTLGGGVSKHGPSTWWDTAGDCGAYKEACRGNL